MLTEQRLDARWLEAPEPFIQATAILSAMRPGQYLYMQLRRVPYPLFDFCSTLSLQYQILKQSDQECELVIYFAADLEPLRKLLPL